MIYWPHQGTIDLGHAMCWACKCRKCIQWDKRVMRMNNLGHSITVWNDDIQQNVHQNYASNMCVFDDLRPQSPMSPMRRSLDRTSQWKMKRCWGWDLEIFCWEQLLKFNYLITWIHIFTAINSFRQDACMDTVRKPGSGEKRSPKSTHTLKMIQNVLIWTRKARSFPCINLLHYCLLLQTHVIAFAALLWPTLYAPKSCI